MKFTKFGLWLGALIFTLDVWPTISISLFGTGGETAYGPTIGFLILAAIQLIAFPFYIASLILMTIRDSWHVWPFAILKFIIGLTPFLGFDLLSNYSKSKCDQVSKIFSDENDDIDKHNG